jgi:hypothetical protein
MRLCYMHAFCDVCTAARTARCMQHRIPEIVWHCQRLSKPGQRMSISATSKNSIMKFACTMNDRCDVAGMDADAKYSVFRMKRFVFIINVMLIA